MNPAIRREALDSDTVWSARPEPYHISSVMVVPRGGHLTIEAGTVVEFSAGGGIQTAGGKIDIAGSSDHPVRLLPANGAAAWYGIVVSGAGAQVSLKYAELASGRIDVTDGAAATIEDSHLHDYTRDDPPILHTLDAGSLTLRRVRVSHYFEVLAQATPVLIEDSLFENISGDGIDLDGAPAGSVIRRSTIRHGSGEDVDGIDIGVLRSRPQRGISAGVLIEQCLISDFPEDKGISIGERARNIVVRNCVIHDTDSGIAVKDSSTAEIVQNTIVNTRHGLHLFEKTKGSGGGTASADDTIVWDSPAPVDLDEKSHLNLTHSDVSGATPPAGEGNLNLDPGFVDPGANDFRLKPDSPLRGRGTGGADLGAIAPAGAPDLPALPAP